MDDLNYILKGTVKAIKDITQRWYADGYDTEADIKRLMLWESKINKYLESPSPKKLIIIKPPQYHSPPIKYKRSNWHPVKKIS